MSKFDIEIFNAKVKEYFDLKQKNVPYIRDKWRVNGKVAKNCKHILDQIGEQIKILIEEEVLLDEFKIKVSEGVGQFPDSPWIAVLCRGETPSCGVYPVLGFYVENWYIGCVDSWQNPQKGFSKKYHFDRRKIFLRDELGRFDSSRIKYPTHVALLPTIFSWRDELSKRKLVKALKKAIDIYQDYNEYKKHSEDSPNENVCDDVKSERYKHWELALPYLAIIILAILASVCMTIDGCKRPYQDVLIESKLMIGK